jgi:PIN domain nuclease of toxin-antitoxin system
MNGRPVLLDTCAALWLAKAEPLAAPAEDAMSEAVESGTLFVSPILAWEIGLLVSRGRIFLSRSPIVWFEEMFDFGVTLAAMPPSILLDSSFLPGGPPRDPADRIMAATARAYGYRLITRDRALLDYGEAGHLEVIAC